MTLVKVSLITLIEPFDLMTEPFFSFLLLDDWNMFTIRLLIFLTGYLLNYLPYFFVERTLFLYFYLPSLIFKYLLFASFLEYLYPRVDLLPSYISQSINYLRKLYLSGFTKCNNGMTNGKVKKSLNKTTHEDSQKNGFVKAPGNLMEYSISPAFAMIIALLSVFLYAFWIFLPLSYGSGSFSGKDIESLRWRQSWLFIVHKK